MLDIQLQTLLLTFYFPSRMELWPISGQNETVSDKLEEDFFENTKRGSKNETAIKKLAKLGVWIKNTPLIWGIRNGR